jgi:signal transduction histidine kinase
MRLPIKTAIYLSLASLFIAFAGVFTLNWFIHKSMIHEIDEILVSHLELVESKLKELPKNQISLNDIDDNPHVEMVSPNIKIKPTFTDANEIDLVVNEPTPIRVLKTTIATPYHNFLVTVKQPYEEFEEIATKLSVGVGVCFLALILLMLLLNFLVYRELWKPFYRIIDKLRTYQISKQSETVFEKESTEEFNLLSQTLQQMTERIGQQFRLQKQFTENASHEIQTPIAVISLSLDTLLQSENLPEKDLFELQKSTEALKKISQLNKSLLLLTKIENNQFSEAVQVDMSKLLENLLNTYQTFAEHREITIFQTIQAHQVLSINPYLAEILVGNLLKNAIRYNQKQGTINCTLQNNKLTISNKGEVLPFASEQLFQRFIKHPNHPESTGLGLAIVKQIAECYALKLHYEFNEITIEHSFEVSW